MSREVHVQFCERAEVRLLCATHLVIRARKGQGPQLLERLKRWLTHRGLKLNETKTRLVDLRREGIKFLGFEIMGRQATHSKKWYCSASAENAGLRIELTH